MEAYRVSFFGHRRLFSINEIENRIQQIAEKLIDEKEFVEFYVGRNGDFDISAASAIKRAQKARGKHNNALILVLPYKVTDIEYYDNFYDEIVLPVENAHFKAAITKRNEWMIDNCDLTVCYVENETGGAYNALKYAEKSSVKVINIAREAH